MLIRIFAADNRLTDVTASYRESVTSSLTSSFLEQHIFTLYFYAFQLTCHISPCIHIHYPLLSTNNLIVFSIYIELILFLVVIEPVLASRSIHHTNVKCLMEL